MNLPTDLPPLLFGSMFVVQSWVWWGFFGTYMRKAVK